jgi:hypothetical protein
MIRCSQPRATMRYQPASEAEPANRERGMGPGFPVPRRSSSVRMTSGDLPRTASQERETLIIQCVRVMPRLEWRRRFITGDEELAQADQRSELDLAPFQLSLPSELRPQKK